MTRRGTQGRREDRESPAAGRCRLGLTGHPGLRVGHLAGAERAGVDLTNHHGAGGKGIKLEKAHLGDFEQPALLQVSEGIVHLIAHQAELLGDVHGAVAEDIAIVQPLEVAQHLAGDAQVHLLANRLTLDRHVDFCAPRAPAAHVLDFALANQLLGQFLHQVHRDHHAAQRHALELARRRLTAAADRLQQVPLEFLAHGRRVLSTHVQRLGRRPAQHLP